MDLFFELLDEAMDAGHRVLVFSQFVSMLTILRAELHRRGLRYCYLDGATQERLKIVQEFNRDASIPLFLISLKAGGTGLNLTGADMVIHYDPWWNPAVENQATDRAYRIGQKRTVYSVKLIAQDSIEERVLALQRKKQKLYNATLEDDDSHRRPQPDLGRRPGAALALIPGPGPRGFFGTRGFRGFPHNGKLFSIAWKNPAKTSFPLRGKIRAAGAARAASAVIGAAGYLRLREWPGPLATGRPRARRRAWTQRAQSAASSSMQGLPG
jgi:hypothetical protein